MERRHKDVISTPYYFKETGRESMHSAKIKNSKDTFSKNSVNSLKAFFTGLLKSVVSYPFFLPDTVLKAVASTRLARNVASSKFI